MSEQRTLFQSARFLVTEGFLRTPRKTYKLRDIDYVQVKRPFLLLTISTGTLLLGWAAVFHELLYPFEWLLLASGVVVSIIAASRLAVLVVHSWSLRGGELEDAIVWDVNTVRRIRTALDEAMHNAAEIRENSNAGQGGRRHDN
jgi:hypothetical protein